MQQCQWEAADTVATLPSCLAFVTHLASQGRRISVGVPGCTLDLSGWLHKIATDMPSWHVQRL